MNSLDYPVLHERLNELADALGAKRPTEAGLKVWASTLREFYIQDVVDVITGWPKRSSKMAAPADIWKPLNDARADKIEAQAIAEKQQFESESARTFRRADAFGSKLRGLLGEMKKQSPAGHKDWATLLYNRFVLDQLSPDGKQLNDVQIRYACSALGVQYSDAVEERDQQRRGLAA